MWMGKGVVMAEVVIVIVMVVVVAKVAVDWCGAIPKVNRVQGERVCTLHTG